MRTYYYVDAVLIPNFERKIAALEARIAAQRASPGFASDPSLWQAVHLAPLMAERKKLCDELLAPARAYVQAEERKLFKTEAAVVDREAGAADPAKASAALALGLALPAAEAAAYSEVLVGSGDRAGCFGIRMALLKSSDLAGVARVFDVLNRPDAVRKEQLRIFVAATRAFARCMCLTDATAEAKVEAAHRINMIPLSSGELLTFSDEQLERLLADDGA